MNLRGKPYKFLNIGCSSIQADCLNKIISFDDLIWLKHVNNNDYSGNWSVVALTCPAEHRDAHPILQSFAIESTDKWIDLPILSELPEIQSLLTAIKCPLKSVRLMKLAPQSEVKAHRDHGISLDNHQARLHVALSTNDDVQFMVGGLRVPSVKGELYYVDVDQLHSVRNESDEDWIHLVIDCEVNDWLLEQLGMEPLSVEQSSAVKTLNMDEAVAELRSTADDILDYNYEDLYQNKATVDRLSQALQQLTAIKPYPEIHSGEDETITRSGRAISMLSAARCADDYMRTQVFLQGVYRAIMDKSESVRHKLSILYVGTGPYGLLITPLLHRLPDCDITMVDIHQESVECLNNLLQYLGNPSQVKQVTCSDIFQWQPENSRQYDIIISETMLAMLKHEPQVEIFRYVYPWLKQDGLLIPESIDIGLRLENAMDGKADEKIDLGWIARLNLSSLSEKVSDKSDFFSGQVSVPGNGEQYLKGLTRIQVYEDCWLEENQSGLTLPATLARLDTNKTNQISYRYESAELPDFCFDFID